MTHDLSPPGSRRREHPSRGRTRRGFTLIELLVAIAVLAVLLALAAPSMRNMTMSNNVGTETEALLGDLRLARSEAVRRAQGITLLSTDGTQDYAAKGWQTITDKDEDGAAPSSVTGTDGTVLNAHAAPMPGIAIKRVVPTSNAGNYTEDTSGTDRAHVVFTARGTMVKPVEAAYFRLCDANRSGSKGRVVSVNTAGAVSLEKIDAICP